MCGIVGYIGNNKASDILINGLKNLEYRGYDSCGIATIEKNGFEITKSIGRVANLENMTENNLSNIGIAHTRWATHGKPTTINSHPHISQDKKFTIVHNGIIENYTEIKQLLENSGYILKSDTDSEVIPNLISLYYTELKKDSSKCFNKNTFLDAVSMATKELKGSYALAILCSDFPDLIIATRKESPLIVASTNSGNYISSDIHALTDYTNTYYILDDLDYCILEKSNISFYNNKLRKIKKNVNTVDFEIENNHDINQEYMLKEIYEQPQALRNTIDYYEKNPINFDKDYLNNIDKIYLIGCGTAMHAALSIKSCIEKLTNKLTIVDIASEFRYRDPFVDEKSLCIFISQSGETADTLAALKLCNEKGAKTIAITNVFESSITRYANKTFYTYARPEIAVASTKAYTCQVCLLYILALSLSKSNNLFDEQYYLQLEKDLRKIPTLVNTILNSESLEKIKEFSKKVITEQSIYFIGRLVDEVASKEGALKLKEISYIHAESYASGELKHGAIALIEDGVTVIAIMTDPSVSSKTLSNIEEVITRGAKVFVITNLQLNKDFDLTFNIPKTNTFLSPILSIIPQQLFAFYVAKNKGYDIDKPRNLAKSVTVE